MEPKKLIVAAVEKEFPFFPVTVEESPEDDKSFWVRVFAVPPTEVRRVKDFVHDLQDEFFPDASFILLPMVKNLSTTGEHYPDFLRQAANARLQATLQGLGDKIATQSQHVAGSDWRSPISTEWTVFPCQAMPSGPDYSITLESKWLDDLSVLPVNKGPAGPSWDSGELTTPMTARPDFALAA